MPQYNFLVSSLVILVPDFSAALEISTELSQFSCQIISYAVNLMCKEEKLLKNEL